MHCVCDVVSLTNRKNIMKKQKANKVAAQVVVIDEFNNASEFAQSVENAIIDAEIDAAIESVTVDTSLDFTQAQEVTESAAQQVYNAVKQALEQRNATQYSKDNDLSLKLLSVAQMQVMIDAQLDVAKFAVTVAQSDKSKSDFIAVKALYKTLALLNAIANKSIAKCDDYTAIILHNARLMQNELTYEHAAYSLFKQITFDEEKLEKLSSVKLARKNVKASTMSTQRSSSKNALALLQCIAYADKKITLNTDSAILKSLQALDA